MSGEQASQGTTCLRCGWASEAHPELRFCPQCGALLEAQTPDAKVSTTQAQTPVVSVGPITQTGPAFQTLAGFVRAGGRGDAQLISPGMRVHHYEVVRPIGEGGMSTVFEARHRYIGHVVALKTVRPEIVQASGGLRFLREARVLARLQHPGVVRIHDAGLFEDIPYMVLEYLEGETLAQQVMSRTRMSVGRVLDLLEEMARVLMVQEAHDVIHRDIKPSNIVVRPSGRFCLFDYGISDLEEPGLSEADNPRLTASGQIMGTPHYMAPEQTEYDQVTHRSDLFALGLTAWECLTGFRARTEADVFDVIRESREPVSSVLDHRPDVPGSVDVVLKGLLETDPDRRYPSAKELLVDVERYRYGEVQAHGPTLGSVFVATPFRDSFDALFNCVVGCCLKSRLSPRRIDRMTHLTDIWGQIAGEIYHATAVIADFSGGAQGPNPNVLTEAAHARALNKDIIILTQDPPETLPFDWRHVPVVTYEDTPGGLDRLEGVLNDRLRAITLRADEERFRQAPA